MDKNRPKTYKAIARRITALVLALWLVFMVCLTWAVAKDFYNQIAFWSREVAVNDYHTHYHTDFSEDLPGYDSLMRTMYLGEVYSLLDVDQLLPIVYPQKPDRWGSDDWFYGKWDLLYGFEFAVVMYDDHENILLQSGNGLSFSYCTEASWVAQCPEVAGLAYINLDAMAYGQNEINWSVWGGNRSYMPSTFSSPYLRMTGYFVGDEFIPVTIDRPDDIGMGLIQEYSPERLALRDGRGYLKWENVYTVEAPENVELTTIYSWETGGYVYEPKSVVSRGRQFDSLLELLRANVEEKTYYGRENLLDSIVVFYGKMESDPEVARYALAVRCWPMQYALLRMIPMYMVSFALVALALWLILRAIKRNVTSTLEMLIHRLTTDAPIEHLSRWQEPHDLETILKDEQEQRRQLVNDNQQLQMSLEYAHSAEENRRKLVSNITHELKTPLAIIHSYAEGLQSGIAGEKREKYLATILEEAERMDGMVLEMLDFSRLESGKVKLSADHFSLLALTESIVEKLTPAAEARDLTISWGFINDCCLTADESRLGQVVTNLLSNALRYTPEGGTIWIRVFSDEKDATFQIENTGEHLPPETLEKIFESFYRADDSRTGKGTGLGLPIAKSIVELHRGKLTARNTWDNGQKCIQFAFTIPLK